MTIFEYKFSDGTIFRLLDSGFSGNEISKLSSGKDWVLLRQDTDCIDHDVISETYQCPKKLISLRALSRKLTEEQRQAAAERLRKVVSNNL